MVLTVVRVGEICVSSLEVFRAGTAFGGLALKLGSEFVGTVLNFLTDVDDLRTFSGEDVYLAEWLWTVSYGERIIGLRVINKLWSPTR